MKYRLKAGTYVRRSRDGKKTTFSKGAVFTPSRSELQFLGKDLEPVEEVLPSTPVTEAETSRRRRRRSAGGEGAPAPEKPKETEAEKEKSGPASEPEPEYPIELGGGWFVLSNKSRVQGSGKAHDMQKKLNAEAEKEKEGE